MKTCAACNRRDLHLGRPASDWSGPEQLLGPDGIPHIFDCESFRHSISVQEHTDWCNSCGLDVRCHVLTLRAPSTNSVHVCTLCQTRTYLRYAPSTRQERML